MAHPQHGRMEEDHSLPASGGVRELVPSAAEKGSHLADVAQPADAVFRGEPICQQLARPRHDHALPVGARLKVTTCAR